MNSRATLPELVRDSKLEARFHPNPDIPVATIHTKSSGRRTIRQDIWVREKKLGHGGYGIVWLERNNESTQGRAALRAVKELRVHGSRGGDYIRELEALAKFSQEKFVQYFVKSHGWFESNDHLFIAMEYCEHGDLKKYLAEHGRLPEDQAQEIGWQVLQGLKFMHENRFAHRDLKPANILIKSKPTDEWHVKICDLGLSKRIGGERVSTTIRGTPGFTPPELLAGDSQNVDPFPADMWCLGEIIFHILTLRPTFNNPLELLDYSKGVSAFPRTQLEIVGASQECVTFVRGLMHSYPEKRLSSIEANDTSWMLAAASELSTSLPDLSKLSPNFGPGLSTNNHTYVDGQPSGSWSTMTQRFPHNNESFAMSSPSTMSVDETIVLGKKPKFRRETSIDSWESQEKSDEDSQRSPHNHISMETPERPPERNQNRRGYDPFKSSDHDRRQYKRSRRMERDSDSSSGRRVPAKTNENFIPRSNEYFLPDDGIDRVVITADICRYLGNDASVRPGNYQNPQTLQVQAGYFINAYRNLTTSMVADLKADSERWDAERRLTRSTEPVEYRASTTHQSRQYYGPTETSTTQQSGPSYAPTPTLQQFYNPIGSTEPHYGPSLNYNNFTTGYTGTR